MNDIVHLAADRLGPHGELYQCCDGRPLAPLLPEYSMDERSEDSANPIFCEECKRVARSLDKRSTK